MKLIQPPNTPLVIFLSAAIIGALAGDSVAHNVAYVVFVIAGVVWSYLEICDGINWIRRLLGVIVMSIIATSLYRELFF